MADSDKDILITPNTSVATTHPEIKFVGKDDSPMYLRVLDDNTLSFEGTEGQVFSMSPTMSSGDIFSVSDISGMQSVSVNADGTITLNPTNSKRVEITGSVMIPESERIYFRSTDTYIGSDADSSEDLHIGADGHIELEADGDVIIEVGSTEYARFDGSALALGIGTATPARKLEIKETGTGAAYLRLSSSNTSYPNDTIYGGIEFYNADASGAGVGASIDALSNGSGRGGWLQFRTDPDGSGSPSVAMSIDENQNVGIGVEAPAETLHVVGPDSGPIAKFERSGQESIFISGNNGWGNIYTSDAVLTFGTGGDSGANAQMALNGNVLTIGDGDTQSGTDGAKLHVHDEDGYALVQATGIGTDWINAGVLLTQRQTGSTQRGLGVFMHDETNDNEWYAGRSYGQESYIVAYDSSASSHANSCADINGSNASPLFTIKDNGSVGIGTTSPGATLEVAGTLQGQRTVITTVSSNTTLTDGDSGTTVYWTGGTLTLPPTAITGQQFVVINNTGGSATPALGTSNAIVSGWTAHAAMADETARTYISPATNKWLYIG